MTLMLSIPTVLFSMAALGAPANEDLDASLNAENTLTAPSSEAVFRVVFIGDSTVSSYREESSKIRGWGQVMPAYFKEDVAFLNAARSGASTKSFLDAGWWQTALEFSPDYVFIQFGHNDQKQDPDRGTDHNTTYRDNLRKFVREAREAGATPILVTPVARRTFRNGDLHTSLQPWADAVQAVALEEKVPVIDLHALSMEFYRNTGEDAGAWINAGSPQDRTHFSEEGARAIAGFIAAQLPSSVPTLAAWLKSNEANSLNGLHDATGIIP